MKIGIAGIGGIGSNVARHLAQARIGAIMIVDFDRVEGSNLDRQFYRVSQVGKKKTDSLAANLKDIYPDMVIEKIDRKILPGDSQELFSECAVVVEGLDDKHLKKMILEELSGIHKTLVCASGIAGKDMDSILVKTMGNCYIVGDFVSDQDDYEFFPPKIAMIAAIMSSIVLKTAKEKEND